MDLHRKTIPIYEDSISSHGYVELLDHLGDDGLTCVNAARVSFNKKSEVFEKKDLKLLNYLIKEKHTSVLEHNVLTFSFKVPLFVARQHMRHRTWSFNEISRRYTSVDLKFYEPNSFRTQHKSNRQASNDELVNPTLSGLINGFDNASDAVKQHHTLSVGLYNSLISSGVCREQARGVLPQNLYTEYYGTVNLHNLLKFISLRTHAGAQWEIQQVAEACLRIATELFPHSVESYKKYKMEK